MTSATPGLPPELNPRGPARASGRPAAARGHVRWPRLIAGVAAVAVLATSGAAWAGLNKIDNNITRIGGILTGDGSKEPPAPDEAQNILLVGSDSRDGEGNAAFQAGKGEAKVEGQRSDSMLLVHLAPGNAKATIISFPRDLYVPIPAYTDPKGKVYASSKERINVAFQRGGPALTIQTIEALTGATVDHYVQVDFAGFQRIVDSVGGVEVCLNKKISDKYSGFKGVAGTQTLNGAQALAFVRQRHGLPAGDLDRIKRQQAFLAATLKQVQSAGTLLNPVTLNNLLDAATQSVSVDDALTVSDMKDLALKLRGIGAGQVGFLTAPIAKPTKVDGQRRPAAGHGAAGGHLQGPRGRRRGHARGPHQPQRARGARGRRRGAAAWRGHRQGAQRRRGRRARPQGRRQPRRPRLRRLRRARQRARQRPGRVRGPLPGVSGEAGQDPRRRSPRLEARARRDRHHGHPVRRVGLRLGPGHGPCPASGSASATGQALPERPRQHGAEDRRPDHVRELTLGRLLEPALRRDPTGPLLTWYDEAGGERVELSATTLDNWVAKTANLLDEELLGLPRRRGHPAARPLAGPRRGARRLAYRLLGRPRRTRRP